MYFGGNIIGDICARDAAQTETDQQGEGLQHIANVCPMHGIHYVSEKKFGNRDTSVRKLLDGKDL
jgi:hypothetical protein